MKTWQSCGLSLFSSLPIFIRLLEIYFICTLHFLAMRSFTKASLLFKFQNQTSEKIHTGSIFTLRSVAAVKIGQSWPNNEWIFALIKVFNFPQLFRNILGRKIISRFLETIIIGMMHSPACSSPLDRRWRSFVFIPPQCHIRSLTLLRRQNNFDAVNRQTYIKLNIADWK